jgi:serine/threonine protein phosphatase PrpC
MTLASFGLTETGSVRRQNQDALLIDEDTGLFAVADGLGGLPNGQRASRLCLDVLLRILHEQPGLPVLEAVTMVNREAREVGFGLDATGFGTTLTLARYAPQSRQLTIAHVGDSAAMLARAGELHLLTVEHTVAAQMVASQWEDACESIPPSAHHTLTQCIGQDAWIDPQVVELEMQPGDRLFLLTDGITKPVPESRLRHCLLDAAPIGRICHNLSFHVEAAGAPDNYTIVAVEFQ